jgi:hypothetical protein
VVRVVSTATTPIGSEDTGDGQIDWGVVKNLLSAIVQSLPPNDVALWIDEPQVFEIRPLDRRPALPRVRFGKDLVQIAPLPAPI